MTYIDHTTQTLPNGTIHHNYVIGSFTMTVFDRHEWENPEPSHINIRTDTGAKLIVTAMPDLNPGEADYLPCDLGVLIENTVTANDAINNFREILLNNHGIATTLNGKRL